MTSIGTNAERKWMRLVQAGSCAMVSLSSVLSGPALAQGTAVENQLAASVCLANTVKGEESAERQFVIAIPPEKAEEFIARGFTRASCSEIQQVDADNRQANQAEKRGICNVAAAMDPAVNLYFWQRYAMTPEEACNTVQAATQQ